MPDPVWYRASTGASRLDSSRCWRRCSSRRAWSACGSPTASSARLRSRPRSLSSVASNLSAALSRDPGLAIDTYVRDEFRHIYRPFVVAMNDGRAVSNRPNSLPPGYIRAVQQRVRRGDSLTTIDPGDGPRDRGPGGGRGGRDRGPGGPEGWRDPRDRPREPGSPQFAPPQPDPSGGPGPPRRGSAAAPIVVADAQIGSVVIPINPPPVFVAIRELGPTLTWVGLVLLAIGAASAALLIFRPAHRRLRTLEHAARALGEGRTDVRAVEGAATKSARLQPRSTGWPTTSARAPRHSRRQTARGANCSPTCRTS